MNTAGYSISRGQVERFLKKVKQAETNLNEDKAFDKDESLLILDDLRDQLLSHLTAVAGTPQGASKPVLRFSYTNLATILQRSSSSIQNHFISLRNISGEKANEAMINLLGNPERVLSIFQYLDKHGRFVLVDNGMGCVEHTYSITDGCDQYRSIHLSSDGLQFDPRLHVMALALTDRWDGNLNDGLETAHSCGNDRCVNPWHLTRVTHTVNMSHVFHKGYHWDGTRWSKNGPSDCNCQVRCMTFTSRARTLPTVPVVPGTLPSTWRMEENSSHICKPVSAANVQNIVD